MTCPNCGAVVGDWAAHQQFHMALQQLEAALQQAAQQR